MGRSRVTADCPSCGRRTAVYLEGTEYQDPQSDTRRRGHFANHSDFAVGGPCSSDSSVSYAFDTTDWQAPLCMADEDGRSYVERLKAAVADALDAKTAAAADRARLTLEELVGR